MSASKLSELYSPLDIPESGEKPFTDYSRWRLLVSDGGRQTWHFLKTQEESDKWPQTLAEKYWLGLPVDLPTLPKATTPLEAARNCYAFYKNLQAHDGHWTGEDTGPLFLLPGFVIGSYAAGMGYTEEERLEMIRYLINRAHPEDGGWGLHIEGHSTVFGTALNYATLRILGMSANHPVAVKARATLHRLGGAESVPAWGKFWLAILNAYDWEGVNPVPPELWLFPDWVPFHPHKWWIHTRNVYIPMSYLYGIRFKMQENDLIRSLREELYTTNYYRIDWPAQRNNIAAADLYAPHSSLLNVMNAALSVYEGCAIPPIRKAALARTYQLIVYEDENTSYQTLSPVCKMMNLLCRFAVEGPNSEVYRRHAVKRADFMWLGAEGITMCGTNGSQLWDTAFIAQAAVEGGIANEPENRESLTMALKWLDICQIRDNPKNYETAYRHRTKGAWPFSTREQGYTVTDCTGEGFKAVLHLQNEVKGMPKMISDERLFDTVDTLLSLQNDSGGYASYELVRGPKWLESINPAEVFGDIMTEMCYTECTTSVITSLHTFRKHCPNYRAVEIDRTIAKAIKFIHDDQATEGGWYGRWGVCYTYATRFALESLALGGECYANSVSVRRACDYLVSKQREDGGWGESYQSCVLERWVEHETTQVVQTCSAVVALMHGKYPYAEPIERAVRMVMSRQHPDGSWTQEGVEGVFSKNCMISYPGFKFSFTIAMLGKAHYYLQDLKAQQAGKSAA